MIDKLQNIYKDLQEFQQYDETYNLAKRYGFQNVKEAWNVNPIIHLSTNPADCRKATKKDILHAISNELKQYEYDDDFLFEIYRKIYSY